MPSDTGGIIRPIGYNFLGEQDEDLTTEDSFSVDQPFLVIANKPIPKYSKLYIEITVTVHPDNPKIRYIPLYLGVHKEPSSGILNSDFCLGSVYYTTWSDNIDFDIMERYNKAGSVTHTRQHDTEYKIPILNTVIGLGVDLPANKIEIYSDGNLFYSFTPKTWVLNQQSDNIYFAIYGLFYEQIEAYINFGKYKTQYLPDGYWTLYNQYYSKIPGILDLPISFLTTGNEDWIWKDYMFSLSMDIENDIAPLDPGTHQRSLFLVHKYPDHMTFPDNESHGFTIISKYNPNNLFDIPATSSDITSVNLPIPNDAKVYFELHVAEGIMLENKLGIPISIGISDKQNELTSKSVRINLWHEKWQSYKVFRYKDNVETEEYSDEIMSASTPTQLNTVGVLYDLGHNKMTITVEGNLFTTVDLSKNGMDFSNVGGLYYAFIKCEDNTFTGDAYGICNFGEEDVEYTLDDDEMTLWYYYNGMIKFQAENLPELEIVFTTLPYEIPHNKYFPINFVVAGTESEEEKKFSPGLNKLFDTYNIVTDTEERMNEPDMDIFEFEEWVKEDLKDNDRRGYYNGDIYITFNTFGGQTIKYYINTDIDSTVELAMKKDLNLVSLEFHDI